MFQFVNLFKVPAGREDQFLALFQEVNTYMRGKAGYRGHRMCRSLAPDATYRFVNLVDWQSPEHFRNAHDEGFRALVSRPEWAPFPSAPALYEIVHHGEPQ